MRMDVDPRERGRRAEYDLARPLDDYVADQVWRSPDAIALSDAREQISYADMWRRVGTLTSSLQAAGVGRDNIVAVCCERSAHLPIALLAILRCGAAYCPLDPAQPIERMRRMAAQAQPAAVLSAPAFAPEVREVIADSYPGPVIELGLAGGRSIVVGASDDTRPDERPQGTPEDPAYVIFTSGSTGQPKGVVIPHRGIVNRLLWMCEDLDFGPDDVILQKTPYGFDVSVWELFGPLLVGGRVHVAEPDEHLDSRRLFATIQREAVTVVHFVPSVLVPFLTDPAAASCPSLRHVVTSGEALPAETTRRALETFAPAAVWNLYGPTEASVDVTSWRCRALEAGEAVPIGRPVANVECLVLDEHGERVGPGATGELCLGGVQVALGYIGQPELTRERFVDIPGVEGPVYRTGDLTRWRESGDLDYLGRADAQVKVAGVRIELGEIEAALREQGDVLDAAVVAAAGPGGTTRILAYVVVANPGRGVEAIRARLCDRLPSIMVPSVLTGLESLPLTKNGKLDRAALPPPGGGR